MSYGVYLSAFGTHPQSHAMKVLRNNLANVDTPGYTPQETILQARFVELIDEGGYYRDWAVASADCGGVAGNRLLTPFSAS